MSSVSSTGYANEGWHGIQGINGTIVTLDGQSGSTVCYQGQGYTGVTESGPTYFRETIKTAFASSSMAVVNQHNQSGQVEQIFNIKEV